MKPPEEDTRQAADRWLRYADEDLALARHGLAGLGANAPHRLIAFHAQQCAEKHLKAFLVRRGIDFAFTHNISYLLEACGRAGLDVADLSDAEELSYYAVTARYPGEDEVVTEAEARRAIDLAERVRAAVRESLDQG